jgi:hypothetical protein
MGIELAKHFGESHVKILTCDKRLSYINNELRKNNRNLELKKRYNIPEDIIYPETLYLPKCSKNRLPRFNEQKL